MKQIINFFVALICQIENRAQARHQELIASILVNSGIEPSKALEHAVRGSKMINDTYPINNLAKKYLDE